MMQNSTWFCLGSSGSSPWLRKPLWLLEHEIAHGQNENETTTSDLKVNDSPNDGEATRTHLERHLTLFDLVSIGVGGTIGSGIFVLTGLIAREYAGPATCISWIIAGIAAALSGCCYAELSGRIPLAGSSYAYVYAAMGELPAVIAFACLTLEYIISGSAVARSWGDKMVDWLKVELHINNWMQKLLNPGWGFNPMAFIVSALSTASLLQGVKESKTVTNFFTAVKVLLVLFMIFGGAWFFKFENLTPFIPRNLGVSGIMRGATSSFFGYIGYDEVCCVAGEAINPQRNLPRAVLLTIGIVTALTVFASLALVGMQPYTEISTTSGFPEAFTYNESSIAYQITAFGEIFTLPIVVLISLMAQPRLNFALSKDGLLPKIFAEVDSSGNLVKGTLISGVFMTVVAAFMPFTFLDDLISSGILVAFSMTNSSLVLMRHESPDRNPFLLHKLLLQFNGLSFLTGLSLKYMANILVGQIFTCFVLILTIFTCLQIPRKCPRSMVFGGKLASNEAIPFMEENEKYFSAPLVPYLPCLGMFINWYLVAQLQPSGLGLLLLYVSFAAGLYFYYGVNNSHGNTVGWGNYNMLGEVEDHRFETYSRSISLPKQPEQEHAN